MKADALLVSTDGLFLSRREQLVALAARHKIPAIYFGRDFVLAGGLMSYGADIAEAPARRDRRRGGLASPSHAMAIA
jgi:putative tryptophan/tyrosine transport system substrate-binding protein